MRRFLMAGAGLVSLGVLTVCVAAASAAPTQCNGPLAGAISGDVQAGPGCDLTAVTTVKGNVKVNPGGSLSVGPASQLEVMGNVQSTKATFIDIEAGTYDKDVKLDGTTGTTLLQQVAFDNVLAVGHDLEVKNSNGSVRVIEVQVGDDVNLHDNKGNDGGLGQIEVSASTVLGDVEVQKNSLDGVDNFLTVVNGSGAGNGSIGGKLEVQDNTLQGDDFNQVEVGFNDVTKDADVHGNKLKGAGGNFVNTHDNQVTGDLQVRDNEAQNGSVDVSSNTVQRDLDCHGNKPHTTGAGNSANHRKGDCKNF